MPTNNAHIENYRGARPNKENPAGENTAALEQSSTSFPTGRLADLWGCWPLRAGWCHQFQLGAITYLEDVGAAAGGTQLIPHRYTTHCIWLAALSHYRSFLHSTQICSVFAVMRRFIATSAHIPTRCG